MKEFAAPLILVTLVIACSSVPKTFVQDPPGWSSVNVAPGLTKDMTWGKVTDYLKKNDMEFEKSDKVDGYIRTAWSASYTKGKDYSTRVLFDFESNGTIVRVKTEARYGKEGDWTEGFDSAYNDKLKNDITLLIGKV